MIENKKTNKRIPNLLPRPKQVTLCELERKLPEIPIIVHSKIWTFKHLIYLVLYNKSTTLESKTKPGWSLKILD